MRNVTASRNPIAFETKAFWGTACTPTSSLLPPRRLRSPASSGLLRSHLRAPAVCASDLPRRHLARRFRRDYRPALGRLDGFKQVAAFVAALPRGQGLRCLSAHARMVPTATKNPASFPAG